MADSRRWWKFFLLLSTVCCLLSAAAYAQNTQLSATAEKPLEITADETLEWHRGDRRFIARGDVIARQGEVEIRAETMTVDYRETSSSSFDIYRLTAEGRVLISSQGNTAQGDKAIYDVPEGKAVMTGNNLALTAPDQTVTARDSFEYFVTAGRLTANGDVIVTRADGNKLRSDRAAASFVQDAKGQRQLKEMTADGNVVITTPDEVLRGAAGRYDAAANIAALTGNVTITRGPNVLEGERAEVNLVTNVSKMTAGAAAQGGRVRGVFYPGSGKGKGGL